MKREAIEPIKIFYSYSRLDKGLRDQLAGHLAPQEHAKRISTWYDLDLPPGSEWESVLQGELDTADIILLLVSADFLNSKYCYGIELKRAIERHNAGEARVIPIILRQCNWKADYVPFSKLTALPNHHLALTEWTDRDAAFAGVADSIGKVVDELIQQAQDRQHQANLNHYREKVKEYLQDGKISVAEQHSLDEYRDEIGITKEEAEAIQREEQKPYLVREQNQKRYERTFSEIVKNEYPLSQGTRAELKRRQQELQLSDEDVAQIEAQIIAQRKVVGEAPHAHPSSSAPAPSPPKPPTLPKPQPDALKGNYAQLEALLKAEAWKAADKETATCMREVLNRTTQSARFYIKGFPKGGLVEDFHDLEFPYSDLRKIDQLWITHSKGKFGFSVQKQIWKEYGEPYSRDWTTWGKIADQIGWRTTEKRFLVMKEERWRSEDELIYNHLLAPKGHLPKGYISNLQSYMNHNQARTIEWDYYGVFIWLVKGCKFTLEL